MDITQQQLDELTWHVPPRCQGQIVEYAYAVDGDREVLWERVTDCSDGSVSYSYADLADVDGDVEPWNEMPEVDEGDWIVWSYDPGRSDVAKGYEIYLEQGPINVWAGAGSLADGCTADLGDEAYDAIESAVEDATVGQRVTVKVGDRTFHVDVYEDRK